jgi:hypothetical protein
MDDMCRAHDDATDSADLTLVEADKRFEPAQLSAFPFDLSEPGRRHRTRGDVFGVSALRTIDEL